MGYAGKLNLKDKARQMRRKGFSVKEIEKKLNVSRSSVSIWIRDIKLTQEQLNKLYLNKKTGRLKGSIVAAMNKIKIREKLTEQLMEEGSKEVGILSKRDKFIAGIALYLAEGSKGDKNVAFSNSDPLAIKFMAEWLKDYCETPKEKLKINLYIHDNLDENNAKQFWSKLLNISINQFGKSYIVKNNPNRLRKTKHIYGILRINISNVILHRKIMGWIRGLLQ